MSESCSRRRPQPGPQRISSLPWVLIIYALYTIGKRCVLLYPCFSILHEVEEHRVYDCRMGLHGNVGSSFYGIEHEMIDMLMYLISLFHGYDSILISPDRTNRHG